MGGVKQRVAEKGQGRRLVLFLPVIFFFSFLFIYTDTDAKREQGGPSKSHWGGGSTDLFLLLFLP